MYWFIHSFFKKIKHFWPKLSVLSHRYPPCCSLLIEVWYAHYLAEGPWSELVGSYSTPWGWSIISLNLSWYCIPWAPWSHDPILAVYSATGGEVNMGGDSSVIKRTKAHEEKHLSPSSPDNIALTWVWHWEMRMGRWAKVLRMVELPPLVLEDTAQLLLLPWTLHLHRRKASSYTLQLPSPGFLLLVVKCNLHW